MSRLARQSSESERGFVACEVGPSVYAVGIEHVQEIILPVGLSALPHAPPGVIGAVDHRGQIVPLLDLGLRLGFGPTTGVRRKWVLVRLDGRLLGLVVSRVLEVFRVDGRELRPAPSIGDSAIRTTSEVVSFASGMAFVLDTSALAALAEMRHVGASS